MPVLAAIPVAVAAIGTTTAAASTAAAAGAVAAGTAAGATLATTGAVAGGVAAGASAGAAAGGILGTGISAGTAISGVSAAGAVGSGIMNQVKQQEAFKEAQARQNLMAQRQIMDTVKQARVATGQATQNAASQGVSTSSASEGGIGGIQSALTGNLNYLTQFNQESDAQSSDINSASIFGAASKLGSTIFDEQSNGNLFNG